MKIICYAFENSEHQLESPFLNYLEKYSIQSNDSKKKKVIKIKQLANIEAHLDYLLDHQGSYDLPPTVQKYKATNIGILKIKESSTLVRIAFFTKKGEKIILLDAMDKPKLYEKGQKKRVDKLIQKFLNHVEKYRGDYLENHKSLPLTF